MRTWAGLGRGVAGAGADAVAREGVLAGGVHAAVAAHLAQPYTCGLCVSC